MVVVVMVVVVGPQDGPATSSMGVHTTYAPYYMQSAMYYMLLNVHYMCCEMCTTCNLQCTTCVAK